MERTVGLHLFHPQHEPTQTRLLAVQSDGLVRLWALHNTAWVALTTFYLPFYRSVMDLSFDCPSRRLMYIEEIREDRQAAPPERLRIVSREMNFNPDSNGGEFFLLSICVDFRACVKHSSCCPPCLATDASSETITVGCAVSIIQVSCVSSIGSRSSGLIECILVNMAGPSI